MKVKFKIILFCVFVSSLLLNQGCSDDDQNVAEVIITSNRTTGKFYSINKTTGETTELFSLTHNDETLTDARGFVYHPGERKFFISLNSYTLDGEIQKGFLYSVDPATRNVTMINDNDGNDGQYAVWDAIVNWAVAPDDSLIAIGDFNSDASNGIVKFGTDGGRSPWTHLLEPMCCGMGMLYDAENDELLIANGNDSDNSEIILDLFTSDAEFIESTSITNFTNFPDDLSTSWVVIKAMVRDNSGKIFALLFNGEELSRKTYFVEVNLEDESIRYISTLGANNQNQYNLLGVVSSNLIQ